MDELVGESENDVVCLPCSHLMHYGCLKMLIGEKEWIKCPVCGTIYGQMVGDQPNGTMTCTVNKLLYCQGYLDVGTIVINYNMFSGNKGDISFPGTHRVAYLPDNEEGNEVLRLLKEAFARKLIFTVGRSVTTGRDNQIVWNGIHHKTNTSGGSSHFGYPDPTYFKRVTL